MTNARKRRIDIFQNANSKINKPYSSEKSEAVKVSSESSYSCHLRHLSAADGNHSQRYNRLLKYSQILCI